MGFEACYHYHERVEGEYNKEETKTFKKKVGDPFDDVSLEKLAGAIMAQLARRDIWIVDIEIFELSKKPVSFKETKGGIILRNKKFVFDSGEESSIRVEDIMEAAPPQMAAPHNQSYTVPANGTVNNGQNPPHPHNSGPRRPVDWVVYAPELHDMVEIRKKNLQFTVDKKYPVFEKRSGAIGDIYLMLDDTGREQLVTERYFTPGNIQLIADRELGFSENRQQKDGGKLYWGNTENETEMPDIRKR